MKVFNKRTLFFSLLLLVLFSNKGYTQNFGNNNLAILLADSSFNNTTVGVLEINKTSAGQTAIQTIAISGSGASPIRVSGAANRADEIIAYRVLPSLCTGCAVVLPIELINFSAFGQKENILLNWATASETNNQHYEVQRSSDGISFSTIGIVEGAGTYEGRNNYQFTDNTPRNGYNYYRVKNIDFDGSFSESNIIAIEFDLGTSLSIYPNPLDVSKILYIQSENKIEKLSVFNILGYLVFAEINPTTAVQLPQDLSKGFYTMAIEISGSTIIRKLIVEY